MANATFEISEVDGHLVVTASGYEVRSGNKGQRQSFVRVSKSVRCDMLAGSVRPGDVYRADWDGQTCMILPRLCEGIRAERLRDHERRYHACR